MLSSTFELISVASSNSHFIFCFCNFLIAILLLSGFQSSSEDHTTNLDHDMSKRKEAQSTPKAKQFHKGMHVDYEIRNMGTRVTSEEMHMFSTSSDTSTVEVLRDINQDNKSGAYIDTAHFQYHESAKQSHRQDISFKRENVGGASANSTIDRKMYLAKTRKETNGNNFEKSDEKEEDELRRRIEDFIEKMNRGWRAEKLGICYQKSITIMSYPVCVSETMLSSTFELLNQANSNSFVAFLFCNLIIVILLVNSSKNSDNKFVPLSSKASVKNNCPVLDKNNGLADAIEATSINLAAKDNDNDNVNDNDKKTSGDEEEDELTRKVELFIQKVNRSWKAEKLSAYK
ncbi:uncharacterized protein LOC132628545 [Lycium barbarum]|uniref:uncharacterized protein LOC132628545 n=1 Tax=Lycium barbarum TaxID=112863 RepID=UPI00293EEC80|nr:uncharacterized protein LOC132628545 [Lycium barbarum]